MDRKMATVIEVGHDLVLATLEDMAKRPQETGITPAMFDASKRRYLGLKEQTRLTSVRFQ